MVSFALLGCGRIGERHAAIMQASGKLVAVADIDPGRADGLASRFLVPAFYSLTEMLLSPGFQADVLAVCTPNGLHAVHSIEGLRAGLHVICEKPMAIRVTDCEKMIQAADETARHLFIVKQNRFNPPVVELYNLVTSGRLGKVLSVHMNCCWNRGPQYYRDNWKGSRELAGGTLFTQFSHFFDLLCWLFGEARVAGAISSNAMHSQVSELDDQGVVVLEWSSGMIGSVHYTLNAYSHNMEGSITVFGEKGTVKVGGQYLNVMEYAEVEGYVMPELPAGNPPNRYGYYTGSMSNHEEVYRNVCDVLAGKGTIATSAREGEHTVRLIEAIYDTSRK